MSYSSKTRLAIKIHGRVNELNSLIVQAHNQGIEGWRASIQVPVVLSEEQSRPVPFL